MNLKPKSKLVIIGDGFAAAETAVVEAEVVGEEEDDVGLGWSGGGEERGCSRGAEERSDGGGQQERGAAKTGRGRGE